MRNGELFSPCCPDSHAKKLVMGYALRGLLDERDSYTMDGLLTRQHTAYAEWLAAMRESLPRFDCGFYEWLGRDCDSAFVFKPGDLVEFDGHYCVVARRRTREVPWEDRWRMRCETPAIERWPRPATMIELKDPRGKVFIVDALCKSVVPADIPSEIFALACGNAKKCPMFKEGGAA